MEKMIKMHGAGNSFLVIDEVVGNAVEDREKFVIEEAIKKGVDGVLFVQKDDGGMGMRYFDKDGTEAAMCGNGLRCVARYVFDKGYTTRSPIIQTGDGHKKIQIIGDGLVEIDMGPPKDLKKISENLYTLYVGLPHIINFVDSLDKKEAFKKGRQMRHSKGLMELVNSCYLCVNFMRIIDEHNLEGMTYEAGVEDVTQSCGTGATASAYVASIVRGCRFPISVHNPGGKLRIGMEDGRLLLSGPADYL